MYRIIDPELCQGDIVDGVPQIRLRPPLEVIRRFTGRGNREQYAPFPYPPVEGKTPDAERAGKTIKMPPFHVSIGELISAFAVFTRAIVLNYDCDLNHELDHCLVAVVRPISGVHEDDRATVRIDGNHNHFYLPADEELGLKEGYVDFRQITCLDPAIVETVGTRRASLSPEGLDRLKSMFFRFLTRREIIATPPAPAAQDQACARPPQP